MGAIRDNDMRSLLFYLAHRADIDYQSPGPRTTGLHLAIAQGHLHICDLLLQNGADPNIADADLWTPLHHAAYLNRVDAIILLIRRGAKLSVLDKNNKSPLDVAIENLRAHCVTLLRLAMHAESEHPGNALEDESFACALKEFSDQVESMMDEDQPITYNAPTSVAVREQFRKGSAARVKSQDKPRRSLGSRATGNIE